MTFRVSAHTDTRRRSRCSVGGVLVLNTPPAWLRYMRTETSFMVWSTWMEPSPPHALGWHDPRSVMRVYAFVRSIPRYAPRASRNSGDLASAV